MKVGALAALLAMATTASSPSAAPSCGGPYEPCERAFHLGPLRRLQIDASSTRRLHAPDPQADCSRFALSRKQASVYLRKAGRIQADDQHHLADDSSCVASGMLVTRDGRRATWIIGEERDGLIVWSNGERTLLHCSSCPSPPFTPR